MPKLTSRSQLMEYLGAKQRNTVWSWCAVNDEERKVYFSIWTDTKEKRDGVRLSYLIQEPDWGINSDGSVQPARRDQDEKLALVFDNGFEPYGYFIEPKDRTSRPREIEETKTSFIFSLGLERLSGGTVIAYPIARIEIR